MNDLYFKDFNFSDSHAQCAYDNLKSTIQARSKLDLEFLEKFITFSRACTCASQWEVAKLSSVFDKNKQSINYLAFCAEYLGLSENTVKKLYLTYERFVQIVDYLDGKKSFSYILPDFNDFTLSKLFELLSVSIDDLDKAFDSGELHSSMTQKQLRQWVKLHNDGEPTSVDVKEEINDGFNTADEVDTQFSESCACIKDIFNFVKHVEYTSVSKFKQDMLKQLQRLKETLKKEFKLDID